MLSFRHIFHSLSTGTHAPRASSLLFNNIEITIIFCLKKILENLTIFIDKCLQICYTLRGASIKEAIKDKKSIEWFIVDEFYGGNGEFTYVLARVRYNQASLLKAEYVAENISYFLARELASKIYIAYEELSPVYSSLEKLEELGVPIDERSAVYVSSKAERY